MRRREIEVFRPHAVHGEEDNGRKLVNTILPGLLHLLHPPSPGHPPPFQPPLSIVHMVPMLMLMLMLPLLYSCYTVELSYLA